MKIEKIKDDYANEQGRDGWEEYFKWLDLCHTPHDVMQKHYDEIARRYAEEYAKEALKNASENAELSCELANMYDPESAYFEVDKQSILSESNLPSHS